MNNRRFETFHTALVVAQRERDYMPIHDLSEPYWNTYEMLVMWSLVNRMRDGHERPLLPFSAIQAAEQIASGHIDYTKKFALYCAELVDKNTVLEY